MEQSKPWKKLVRPTSCIPEWSSRAEEEYVCEDVGCSPARKGNRDDLRCGRAMRRDRCGEDVPGGLYHDRASRWRSANAKTALRDRRGGVRKPARLAETGRRDACRDGIHGLVLEAGLQHPGDRLPGLPGESGGGKESQGSQNRR